MDFEVTAITETGGRFVELAEKHAADFAGRAAAHDREASFASENIEEMKASGFTAGPVPEQFGGMGVTSIHDLALGMNRLARADGSTAIAINMHLTLAYVSNFLRRVAEATGDTERQATMEGFMALIAGGVICMASATEAGSTIGFPMTEATKAEGGWAINGRKIFGTLSPAADIVLVACRTRNDDGSYQSGFAVVPRGTPGVSLQDDWDTIGMRASGSNGAVYDNCIVPDGSFTPGEAWGSQDVTGLLVATQGNLGLVASFVGIAEAAHDMVIEATRTRTKMPTGQPVSHRHGIQHAVAEMEIALATCRAHLSRVGRLLDEHLAARAPSDVTVDEMHQLNREFQTAKLVINRSAIEAVDKAMQISGGAGYFHAHPLSRLWRDVRAGPFMQPLSPNEAYEYIGKVALGLPPELDL